MDVQPPDLKPSSSKAVRSLEQPRHPSRRQAREMRERGWDGACRVLEDLTVRPSTPEFPCPALVPEKGTSTPAQERDLSAPHTVSHHSQMPKTTQMPANK